MRRLRDAHVNETQARATLSMIALALMMTLSGCSRKPDGTVAPGNSNNSSGKTVSTATDAGPIIDRYRTLDNSKDSTIKLRATVNSSDQRGENSPRQVAFTINRKHQPDGRMLMLVEFTAPAEERDRDGLITVFPDGQIEGVRYVQSTDSYIVTRDVMSEDALFGLTLQELADGQPEKYDFTVAGEETFEGSPVYRMEGKLKHGAESKFARVVLLISKQNHAAVHAAFYDNHDEEARNLIVTKTEQIGGRWTRTRWTIDNRARHKKIDFEAFDVRYDVGLKDSMFTREHLKKIASR